MIKNFIKQVKLLFPVFLTFFLFVLSSIVIYFLLNSFYNKKEKFRLAILHNNIKEIIKHDLESAISSTEEKFSLFSNYKQDKNLTEQEKSIRITNQNTIIINGSNSELTLDLQELKEFIDKILPSYIVYKISLDNQIIAFKGIISKQYQQNSSLINVADIANLSIELSISENSEYYQKINDKFYADYFSFISIAFLINSLCLLSYYLIRNRFNATREKLTQNIDELNNKNKSLLKYIKICKKLENMYADLKYISKTQPSIIDVKELAEDIENYFSLNESNIIIKCIINAERSQTHCCREVFYQLIFSLVNLLIMFINGQSEEQKLLTLSFDEDKMLLEFESFALDEEKMLYLADNVLSISESFFLLDCRSLFESLKTNNFKYNFNLTGEYNHKIEIITSISEKLPDNSKILKFRTSKDV